MYIFLLCVNEIRREEEKKQDRFSFFELEIENSYVRKKYRKVKLAFVAVKKMRFRAIESLKRSR